MVFLDQGSASSVQQHSQEVMKALGQLLTLLAQLKRDEKEKPSLDHECAEATEALLRSQGTITPLENGRSATRLSRGNYELMADLTDRSGKPTFAVYDLESGEKVLSARRTAKGDYELHAVNQPLTVEQKQAFLSQLHQTAQGVPVPGLTGLERVQALVDTLDDQAPRGCKAMLVAEHLLSDQLEASDQQYTYARGEDGSLAITDTKSDALVAVMSATGAIDQALSQKDQTYFKQAYERLLLLARQSPEAAVVAEPASTEAAVKADERSMAAPMGLSAPQTTGSVVAVAVEVVDGEFVEPQGQRRIQARVSQHGLESAGGDLALSVGASLVSQQGGREYVGERYQSTAYGNGAMTIHATGNPVPLVYANSRGDVTSQLTPEQTSQFRQMYQSLAQPQVAAPTLAAAQTVKPRALNPARSFDLGGR